MGKKLAYMVALVVGLLFSITIGQASNCVFDKDHNFLCLPLGNGNYQFSIAVYSEGGACEYDHWMTDGKITATYKKDGKVNTLDIVSGITAEKYSVDNGDKRNPKLTVNYKAGSFVSNSTVYEKKATDGDSKEVYMTTEGAKNVDGNRTLVLTFNYIPTLDLLPKDGSYIKFEIHFTDNRAIDDDPKGYSMGSYPYNTTATQPMLLEPYLDINATDSDEGSMKFAWSAQSNVYKYVVTRVYKDPDTTIVSDTIYLHNKPAMCGEFEVPQDNKECSVFFSAVMYADLDMKLPVSIKSNKVTMKPYHDMTGSHMCTELSNGYGEGLAPVYEDKRVGAWKNYLTWTIDSPSENDYVSTEAYQVERAYSADFSDATVISSVLVNDTVATVKVRDTISTFEDSETAKKTGYYRIEKAIYAFTDSTSGAMYNPNGYSSNDSVQVFATSKIKPGMGLSLTKPIESDGSPEVNELLSLITVPKQMIYYRVARASAFSFWSSVSPKFFWVDSVYKTTQLPLISEAKVVKDSATWKNKRQVTLSLKLNNYHVCDLPAFKKISDDSQVKAWIANFQESNYPYRLYTWDPNAIIKIVRYNKETGDTAVISIDGSKVGIDKDSNYVVSTTDVINEAYSHYYYKAVIDPTYSYIPINHRGVVPVSLTEDADSLYYESSATINSISATDDNCNYIHVKWSRNAGPFSYYTLERRPSGQDAEWSALDLGSTSVESYVDKEVNIGQSYDYRLSLIYNHNGRIFAVKDSATGYRTNVGVIAGRVTTPSGVGVANVRVCASLKGDDSKADTVLTGQDGTYSISCPVNSKSANYLVYVTSKGSYSTTTNSSNSQYNLTLSSGRMEYSESDFVCSEVHVFEGRALYAKTTVPVKNANFKVNGDYLYDKNGNLLATDAYGNFNFELPQMEMTIQIVKNGHTFNDGGFIHEQNFPENKKFTPTVDYKGLEMIDSTTVRLAGRIAAGTKQADLPLGFGLSTNYIGDSLTLVLQLEGDNTSLLLFDERNQNKTQEVKSIIHPVNLNDTVSATTVITERKRVTIKPDQLTGEFYVDLLPEKYKVVQMYAQGYPSLFGNGEASQIVDLSVDSLVNANTYSYKKGKKTYKVAYNQSYIREYHAPVELSWKQRDMNLLTDVLGEQSFEFTNLYGNAVVDTVAIQDDTTGVVNYQFGHPIFEEGKSYSIVVSANEVYHYNGNQNDNKRVYEPCVPSCQLHYTNGLTTDKTSHTLTMDTLGVGTIVFTAGNPTFSLTEEDALRYLNMAVEVDGYYYAPTDTARLGAFVTGSRSDGDVIYSNKNANVVLFDVLRDPPGAYSSAYIETGTKYAFQRDVVYNWSVGMTLNFGFGSAYTGVVGTQAGVGGGVFSGTVMSGSNMIQSSRTIPIIEYSNNSSAIFNFEIGDRIETSADPENVGAMADVYFGMTTNDIMEKEDVLCLIDYPTFKTAQPSIARGKMKVIAKSRDAVGDSASSYLVVAHKLNYKESDPSFFTYTQKAIVDEVIPSLIRERDALVKTCSKDEAESIAKSTHSVVYYCDNGMDMNDPDFATDGNYKVADPEGLKYDEVSDYNTLILKWVSLVAQNERAKLNALMSRGAVTDYTISSDVKVKHDESEDGWSSNLDGVGSVNSGFVNFFKDLKEDPSGMIMGVLTSKEANQGLDSLINRKIPYTRKTISNDAMDKTLNGGSFYNSKLNSLLHPKTDNNAVVDGVPIANNNNAAGANAGGDNAGGANAGGDNAGGDNAGAAEAQNAANNNQQTETDACSPTVKFTYSIYPVIDYNNTDKSSTTVTNSIKTGFTLQTNDDSNLDIACVRLSLDSLIKNQDSDLQKVASFVKSGDIYCHDYIFYVRGGATRSPYEFQDTTIFLYPGTPLGNSTLLIEQPKIEISQPSVSNVPQDEKAMFTVKLINDSESENAIEKGYTSTFVLTLDDSTNKTSAKVYMDGMPITDGRNFTIPCGGSITKTIEVERGVGFDINDLGLILSTKMRELGDEAYVTVNYVRVASPITMVTPQNKWVLNTLSQHDSIGYFLPIEVNGFNTHCDGFDHIEVQYKQTTKGEDAWVNLCSYYAEDSLYQRASGNKKMLTTGGSFKLNFYGEKDPMEMQYDIRAVSFSRFGNSFVTRSSSIMTGTKDTRCPNVFGTPEPTSGILNFGDNIKLQFTEPIAYNYLDKTANFDILGYKYSTELNSVSALKFSGNPEQKAYSIVDRNLVDLNFTIDMMVRVDSIKDGVTLLSHGTDLENFSFGITKDNQLTATINGKTFLSKPFSSITTSLSSDLNRVGMMVDNETHQVSFFMGKTVLGNVNDDTMKAAYEGDGPIYLGYDFSNPGKKLFSGSMREVRIWADLLNEDELVAYDGKLLTGYEDRLLAHYSLNETQGNVAHDGVNGADLTLVKTTWGTKIGHSLKTGKKPVKLDASYLQEPATSDFTLGFWFRPQSSLDDNTDTLAIFTAGSKDATQGKLFVGFEEGDLVVRAKDVPYSLGTVYGNGEWHHFMMTVCRSQNAANIYVDGQLVSQLNGSLFDGIASDYAAFGNKKMSFNIDLFTLWKLALPTSFIENHYNDVPDESDTDLLVYLPFEQDTATTQGVESAFSIYNEKREYDSNIDLYREKTPMLLDVNVSKVDDKQVWAPITQKATLSKLDFDWSSTDQALLINLLENDEDINNQEIYLTVRNVEDLNGNLMKSPVMWSVYTRLNQLMFEEKLINVTTRYGETGNLNLTVVNKSGSYRNYTIETYSDWLTSDIEKGIALPATSSTMNFKILGNMVPGEYYDVVTLTDENGLTSNCLIILNVVGDSLNYEINKSDFDYTMVYKGQVMKKTALGNEVVDDEEDDIVYAFIGDKCVGKSNIDVNESGQAYVYMTIYGTAQNAKNKDEVTFKVWDAAKYELIDMTSSSAPVIFTKDGVVGCVKTDTLHVSTKEIRSLYLEKGWNWISVNVKPNKNMTSLSDAFFTSTTSFSSTDVFKSPKAFDSYSVEDKTWKGSIKKIASDTVYLVKVANAGTYNLIGSALADSEMVVTVKGGQWSPLPYLASSTMPINTALADLQLGTDVQVGDMVKSLTQFAFVSENNVWEGDLKYLREGEGYFIKLQAKGNHTISYHNQNGTSSKKLKSTTTTGHANNMPVIAEFADGVEYKDQDKLVAYANGEKAGEANLTNLDGVKVYLLSVNAEQGDAITFAQERDGQTIAATKSAVRYDANGMLGSEKHPYAISFTGNSVVASPSLFTETVTFTINTETAATGSVKVYNAEGGLVWEQDINTALNNVVEMNGSNFAAGVYSAVVKAGDIDENIKLVKE